MQDAVRTKQQARDEFEAWASTYDRSLLNHFLFRPSVRVFIEEVVRWHEHTQRPFDILDIGCGTGSFLARLASTTLPVQRMVGLDYAMEMCVQGQAKARVAQLTDRIQFVHGDSEFLPFADGSFDLVTCANSFHHYPRQQAVVNEMHRLLRPGGQLMIIDGFRDNVIGWAVFDVIITAVEKAVFHAPWSTMRSYFEAAGFDRISQRKFNVLFAAFVTMGIRAPA